MKSRFKFNIFTLIFTMASFNFLTPVYANMESSHYRIEGEDVTSGGQEEGSANYSVWEDIGNWVSSKLSSSNYSLGGGPTQQIQAHGPSQPTFENDTATRYDRLKYTIDNGGNPTDALFAIAITDDGWSTTNFIQADGTIASSIAWQTYTGWGGASGEYVTGLKPDTAYKIKVVANRGDFTTSPYSGEAEAATVNPQITFDIDINTSHSETSAPYAITVGELYFNTITTGTNKIYLDLTTNTEQGTTIYVKDSNNGLYSSIANYTISSASETLQTNQDTDDGYGLQNGTWSASSGSWTESGTYNVSGNSVGAVSTNWSEIANTTGDTLVSGSGEIIVKAVAAKITPAVDDYEDTITFRVIATY